MISDVLFANEVLAGLSNPERGINGYCSKKRIKQAEPRFGKDTNKRAIMSCRQAVREVSDAQKFFIDRKLVETAVELSFQEPSDIIKMASRSKPCFDNMWIEWDEDHRVDFMMETTKKIFDKKYHEYLHVEFKEGTLSRIGYHIQKINGQPFYTMYGKDPEFSNGKINILHNGFYFSNQEELLTEEFKKLTDWERNTKIDAELDNDTPSFLLMGKTYPLYLLSKKGDAWVNAYIYNHKKKNDKAIVELLEEVKYDKFLKWFSPRIETAQSRGTEMFLTDKQFNEGFDHHKMSKLVGAELVAMNGDLRFLICVLGLLNYDHIVYNNAKTNSQVSRLRYGMHTPKHTFKLVTIDLPKPNIRRICKGIATGTGVPKAEHWRRGHWRKMPKKRIWIEPMKVGNKKNGVIEHDYILRGRKNLITDERS
tara:strand:- start:729 stop:1997 length:1269 start_codon:yes stop_codon:yes gene_type:complete